jgi:hypothetical protein
MIDVLTLFLFIAAVSAAGTVVWFWYRKPDGAPTAAETSARLGDVEMIAETAPEPVAAALPRGVRPLLAFDGPPGAVTMDKPELSIGRHTEADVRLGDIRVSRRHAKVFAKPGGGFEIVNETADRSDPNPVMVNGKEMASAELRDGDVVTLGGVTFTFRLQAA